MSLDNPSLTPEALAAIRARLEPITPGPWRAMSAGNCTMEDGRLAAIAEVEGLPRPWNPVWVGWMSAKNYFKTFLRTADAEFIAHAPADLRALLAQVEALQQRAEATETDEARAVRLVRQTEVIDAKVRQRYGAQIRELTERAEAAESQLRDLAAQHAQMREALTTAGWFCRFVHTFTTDNREGLVGTAEDVCKEIAEALALSPRLAPGSRDER